MKIQEQTRFLENDCTYQISDLIKELTEAHAKGFTELKVSAEIEYGYYDEVSLEFNNNLIRYENSAELIERERLETEKAKLDKRVNKALNTIRQLHPLVTRDYGKHGFSAYVKGLSNNRVNVSFDNGMFTVTHKGIKTSAGFTELGDVYSAVVKANL